MSETDALADPLHRMLLAAGDARLRRVVGVVDALPERRDLDAIIAPLRPRLAQLRPARPMTLRRLLFLPVEPLIVPAAAWTPKTPALPRGALVVIAREVGAVLAVQAPALRGRMERQAIADPALVLDIGSLLWPRAGAVLRDLPQPADWPGLSGLPAAAWRAVTAPLSVLLGQGPALYRLAATALPPAAAMGEAERLLRLAAEQGTPALAIMLVLLLRRMSRAQPLLHLADTLATPDGAGGPAAVERAMEFLMNDIRAAFAADASAPQVAAELHRAVRMLDKFQAAAHAAQRPGRLARVRAARDALADHCAERFAAGAQALAAAADAPRADPASLEETARALRRLDGIGRSLGEEHAYDGPLAAAAARVAGIGALPPTARLRLLEILVGPDAALEAMVAP